MAALRAQLAEGNFRTAGHMVRWLKKEHGVELTVRGAYYWLKKCRASLRVPRPVHLKEDPKAGEIFLENLEAKLGELPLGKGRPVRIWVRDEGRFGLHTIVRRCWGLRGVRVVKTNQKKYQWGYLYGALEIGTGKTEALFMPNVGLEVSEVFLRNLAESEPQAEHIVIWDGAGFHQKAGKHALPSGCMSSSCPRTVPNSIRSKSSGTCSRTVCNRLFHTLDEMWGAVCQELNAFYQPERVHRFSVRVPLPPQTLPPVGKVPLA